MSVNGLRGDDPGEWGHSLANLREIMEAVLETAGVRTIAEVGAFAGDLTRDLSDWANGRSGEVFAVDPDPQPALVELAEERESVTLVREPSHEALRHMSRTDAVVIDGDHNYFTVRGELDILAERFPGDQLPLLLLHDVRWPHARRDAYYAPEAIPEEDRHELVSGPVFPGESGLSYGLPFKHIAAEEGGPRNGVLTALEDFLDEHPELTLAVVPAFFGLGVVWSKDAEWAGELEKLLAPWNGNPWMERLEQHRVYTLARFHREMMIMQAELDRVRAEVARLHAFNEHKAELLEQLGESRAFSIGERLSRLRSRNGVPWREQLDALIRER